MDSFQFRGPVAERRLSRAAPGSSSSSSAGGVGCSVGGSDCRWKLLDIAVDPNPVACIVLQLPEVMGTDQRRNKGGRYSFEIICGKVARVC